MAAFIKKPWNPEAVVFAQGVGARYSRTGTYLFVVNGEGADVAKYLAKAVEKYWIEDDAIVHTSPLPSRHP